MLSDIHRFLPAVVTHFGLILTRLAVLSLGAILRLIVRRADPFLTTLDAVNYFPLASRSFDHWYVVIFLTFGDLSEPWRQGSYTMERREGLALRQLLFVLAGREAGCKLR